MKIEKPILIKIIFIVIFFLVTFIAEFIYRKPLFNNSVQIAHKIQDSLPFLIRPFDYFTNIGKVDYILIEIVLFFFPISYSYTFFLTVVLSWHFGGIIKIIYGDGRPFYMDSSVKKFQVSGASGYGNPSGHSIRSSSNYVALVQIIIDLWKLNKKSILIIIYVSIAILVILINFSRVILGAHSINQVIYGDTLGFTQYFVIYKIIKPHIRKPDVFFERFLSLKYHIINWVVLLIVTLYSIIISIVFDKQRNNQIDSKYISSAIDSSLSFTSYYGMIYGMTALAHIIKKKFYSNYESANYFYRNPKSKKIINYGVRIILIFICFLPYYIHFTKISIEEQIYIDIFGYALPMFIYGFLSFGFYYIMNIILQISNKDIYIPHIEDKLNGSDYNVNNSEDFNID